MSELKSLKNLPKKKTSSTRDVPDHTPETLPAGYVQRYVDAMQRKNAAEEELKALVPDLILAGVEYVFSHNCEVAPQNNPKLMISSVNLVSDKPDKDGKHARVQCIWTTRTNKIDEKTLSSFASSARTRDGKYVESATYVEWLPKISFNVNAFRDKLGTFRRKQFELFIEGLNTLAEELQMENPVSFEQELRPKDTTHVRRFQDFDLAGNLAMHLAIPTTVNLKAIVDSEDKDSE